MTEDTLLDILGNYSSEDFNLNIVSREYTIYLPNSGAVQRTLVKYTDTNRPSIEGTLKGFVLFSAILDEDIPIPSIYKQNAVTKYIKKHKVSGLEYTTVCIFAITSNTDSILAIFSEQMFCMLQKDARVVANRTDEELSLLATQVYTLSLEELPDNTEGDLRFEVFYTPIGGIHTLQATCNEYQVHSVSWWVTPKKDLINLPGTANACGEYVFKAGDHITITNDLTDRYKDMVIMTGEKEYFDEELLPKFLVEVVAQIRYRFGEEIRQEIVRTTLGIPFEKQYNYFEL